MPGVRGRELLRAKLANEKGKREDDPRARVNHVAVEELLLLSRTGVQEQTLFAAAALEIKHLHD